MSNLNQVKMVNVTPTLAQEMLKNQWDDQRKISHSVCAKYAAAMGRDEWYPSNDAIVLYNNKLINGQHRLTAVVMSGKTVRMPVMHTDNSKSFNVMDSGKPRQPKDVLHQHGIKFERTIAAAARFAYAFEKNNFGWYGVSGTKGRPKKTDDFSNMDLDKITTRGEIIDYCVANRETFEKYASLTEKLYKETKILYPTVSCALLMIAREKYEAKAIKFIKAVYSGKEVDNVSFTLREKLNKNAKDSTKYRLHMLFGFTIKAFNAYMSGENPKIGFRKGDSFPTLGNESIE